ncbi:MAG: GFA family protein [Myxococcales bacterium]|nr:MAG: GFA family protein [Myxococcales bacterium]
MNNTTKHHGSCLCGDVTFDVDLDWSTGSRCNCTLCTKLGAVGSIVKPAAFKLLSPESKLSSFTRTPEIGRRFFCARCHVYCFGSGRLEVLGGDFVSVNLNCLDDFDVSRTSLIHWDGRHDNWQAGPAPAPWPLSA